MMHFMHTKGQCIKQGKCGPVDLYKYSLCTDRIKFNYGPLKGVLSKNLQKPYICGRGGYNSWGDGAYHVDTLGPTKTQGYRIMF